jgi:hypothetical protein
VSFLDYAEEIAVWVFQHAKVIIWVIPLTMTLRSDFEEPFHFGFPVVGAEVEMESISASSFGRNSLKRYVWTSFSLRVTKNNPIFLRGIPGHVVKRLLPKRHHLFEFITVYDD